MNAYVYQAAMLCEDCAEDVKQEISRALRPKFPDVEETYDSDDYPKGPYEDGGGESDRPEHCDRCSLFLENPLTPDGYEYVESAIAEDLGQGHNHSIAVDVWGKFYFSDVTIKGIRK